MNVQELRETSRRHGLDVAIQDVAYRAVNKVAEVWLLKALVVTMDTVDQSFLAGDAGYKWGFLDAATLRRCIERGEDLGTDVAFMEEAFAKGDRCYGALDGDKIATLGWYSTKPTAVTLIADDVMLRFDPSYAYMYRAYTPKAYRGKRLHAIGVARALQIHADEGSKGLLSCVDTNNYSSLIACHRLGYRTFGWLVGTRLAGRYLFHASAGCEPYGLSLSAPQP